jgi:hypothetical protein
VRFLGDKEALAQVRVLQFPLPNHSTDCSTLIIIIIIIIIIIFIIIIILQLGLVQKAK